MRLSVIIATKDRASYLERALASLAVQIAAPSFEVLVVDNGSTDWTRAVVEHEARRDRFPVEYIFEPEPNRGMARNRGIDRAKGHVILFIDDDIVLPPGFLAAHEAAHTTPNLVVNGPILNVHSENERPKPSYANYSRAFLCTCNVSIPKHALNAVGGFDDTFNLYGWEDTELGVRLREAGVQWRFAWDAYLWHIKLPSDDTLEVQTQKTMEKARMAARFVKKAPTSRVRLATGLHTANLLRARYLLPEALLAIYAGAATEKRLPGWLRSLARGQFLDAMYAKELLAQRDHRGDV